MKCARHTHTLPHSSGQYLHFINSGLGKRNSIQNQTVSFRHNKLHCLELFADALSYSATRLRSHQRQQQLNNHQLENKMENNEINEEEK